MNNELVGRYARYKDNTYLILKEKDDKVQLYNPLLPEGHTKVMVAIANVDLLASSATPVNYRGNDYLVTPKNAIVSLTSGKVMKWGDEHGNRIAILDLAKK